MSTPDDRGDGFIVKQGSHVAVGQLRPLADNFRPTGGEVDPFKKVWDTIDGLNRFADDLKRSGVKPSAIPTKITIHFGPTRKRRTSANSAVKTKVVPTRKKEPT